MRGTNAGEAPSGKMPRSSLSFPVGLLGGIMHRPPGISKRNQFSIHEELPVHVLILLGHINRVDPPTAFQAAVC